MKLKTLGNGIWEITLAEDLLHHEDLFKTAGRVEGGSGERITCVDTARRSG